MEELVPNFTQVPNIIFDKLLPDLTDAELRCLLYICRRTYGFHREGDKISYSQFENGIERNGKQLDGGCGLRKEAISKGLKSLENKGIIRKSLVDGVGYYSMNTNQFDYRTPTGSITEPLPVRLPNIQNIEKESEKKLDWLLAIPEKTLTELSRKYRATPTEIITSGERAHDWCLSVGKKYKNYAAFLRNWILKQYGLREVRKDDPTRL